MANTGPKFAYFQGEIVPIEDAKISVMTHAFNYGTGVFGGVRAYWNANQEQLYIFRPDDHFKRLLQSASLMRMKLDITPERLTDILSELLRKEAYTTDVYIRPLAYKSDERIGVRLHDIGDDLTIFAMPFGNYLKPDGVHAHVSAWRRIDDNMIPARGKITGAYANSALLKSDAMLSGYDEALVLNDDGHISEASGANVFIVRDGVVITPPVNANVLEGITRRSLIQLMRDELNLEIIERDIDRTEIYLADEAFFCGTAVQIAGITRVDHRPIGNGELGEVTTRLNELFMRVVRGEVEAYRNWLTGVYRTEAISQ